MQIKDKLEYDFVYSIGKIPNREDRKKAVRNLNQEQVEILEHIYFNKRMEKDKVREAILYEGYDALEFQHLLELVDTGEVPKLIDIIREADGDNFDKGIIIEMILKYIYYISAMYGDTEARRASKVIFCEQKICLTAKEIREQLERRKQNGKK